MNRAPAVPSIAVNSDQLTDGNARLGSPLGTLPSVATPSLARSQCQLTTMAPTTAISAPGMRGEISFEPIIKPITEADTSTVAVFAWPMSPERGDELLDRAPRL